MALIGASSASATSTALCTSDAALVCAAGNIYTGHIEATAVNPELLSDLVNVRCEKSVILGNALGLGSAADGKQQLTHLELLDFTGSCQAVPPISVCTVATVKIGLVDLLKTGVNTGTVTSLGSEVRVVCTGVIDCTFGGEPKGSAVGASLPLGSTSLGTITVNKAVLQGKGLLCPEQGLWDAKYTIQLPHEIFITE
jgi:hypothetical protein